MPYVRYLNPTADTETDEVLAEGDADSVAGSGDIVQIGGRSYRVVQHVARINQQPSGTFDIGPILGTVFDVYLESDESD